MKKTYTRPELEVVTQALEITICEGSIQDDKTDGVAEGKESFNGGWDIWGDEEETDE